ncbi:permease prefix domain 1-containing protein [Clostridiaceae bacterium M8S5]|nr:permease prefix domain 1-containing protein [Clostridiaceae bacterium M8S5]
MNELSKHVDNLFEKYKHHPNTNELKEEILSNLQAKKEDLVLKGLSETEAINHAKESINSIDYLIDNNLNVYINKVRLEWLQSILIYFIIAWIIIIPFSIFRLLDKVNIIIITAIVLTGISYLILRQRNDATYINEKKIINISFYHKIRKLGWIIWIIFILISIAIVTGIYFGSNIYFSKPINITGPYQLAQVVLHYLMYFISIIVPLAINKYMNLLLKYNEGENYE